MTHEMYAAGHPPLPSIEVATFANSIPRHWWLLAEKAREGPRRPPDSRRASSSRPSWRSSARPSRSKTSMKLLADEAKASGNGQRPRPGLAGLRPVRLLVVPPRPEARELAAGPGLSRVRPVGPGQRVAAGPGRTGHRPPGDGDPAARALRAELDRHQKAVHERGQRPAVRQEGPLAKAAERLRQLVRRPDREALRGDLRRGRRPEAAPEAGRRRPRRSTPTTTRPGTSPGRSRLLVDDAGAEADEPRQDRRRSSRSSTQGSS